MPSLLMTGGHVYTPGDPAATAMAVADGIVVWIGQDGPGRALYPDAEQVDLDGAFVAPAFVDAHVHATSTGLLLTGLDLTGARSLAQCLEIIGAAAAKAPSDAVLWGHGWDESAWPENRPPTRAEIDAVAAGRAVYASRIDVHSALVSTALVDSAPDATSADGWSATAPLSRDAHHVGRRHALASMTKEQRDQAQRGFLRHAASRGIAAVHECSGPDVAGADDLSELLALGAQTTFPEVIGYWGERGVELPDGVTGLAGDLFADGALGSRTAALREPYDDLPDTSGARYLNAEQIAEHVVECTRHRIQAGFHVIGDAGADAVVAGFELAEQRIAGVAMRRHRLEHLEMVDDEQIEKLARWGVVASVQPLFDAAWGGEHGMYAQRLGAERAARLNPFARLAAAGVILAFGSDSPVTPLDPWAAVRAAVHHHTPGSGLSPRAAFAAHTRGGWRATGVDDGISGTLVPGAPATYAVWRDVDLVSEPADERRQRWSTDPRAGIPALPALEPGTKLPTCVRTVRRGVTIFEAD